jgi:arginase
MGRPPGRPKLFPAVSGSHPAVLAPASRLVLVGIPWDASSSFQRGAAEAPGPIREALWSDSSNTFTELGISVDPDSIGDAGDLALPEDGAGARTAIETGLAGILRQRGVPVGLGGDHSVTYPVLRAFRAAGPVTILHIDAHGDLYDQFPLPAFAPVGASVRLRPDDRESGCGDRFSHACPFARIMEDGLCRRLVQVGIRTMTPHLRAQAMRFGAEVYGPDACAEAPIEALEGPVYVSIDLDGLDPAFAPGVSHPEPGGLSVRDVVRLLHRVRAPIVGADVVEYNPLNDVRDLTARVAAKLVKELAAVAIRNGGG